MDFQQIERDVYEWINKCRTNPTSAVSELTQMLKRFKDLHYRDPENKVNIITNEVYTKNKILNLKNIWS